MRTIKFGMGVLSAFLLASCLADIQPSNPYDPELPPEQQARALLSGVIMGEDPDAGTENYPITGVKIYLDGPSVPTENPLSSNADGSFNFGEVIPGTYTIEFRHGSHYTQARDVILSAGEVRELDITMSAFSGDGENANQGILVGVILKDGELNLPEEQQDHSGITIEDNSVGIREMTGPGGDFKFKLNAGNYEFNISAPNYVTQGSLSVTVTAQEETTFPGSPIVLSSNPGQVAGVVLLEGVAADLNNGVDVSLVGSQSTVSIADGSYLISDVPAGTYILQASLTNFDTQTISGISVRGGAVTTIPTFTLSRSKGGVSGQILLQGQAGNDYSGVAVGLTGTNYSATSNADGGFTITQVPTGTYDLVASKDGFSSENMSSIFIEADSTTDIGIITLVKSQGDFLIENGQDYTNSRTVDLSMDAPDGSLTFRITGDLDASANTDWQAYDPQASYSTTLEDSDGLKTLTVYFRDDQLTLSSPFSDQITLDRQPPVPIAGESAVVINDGSSFTNNYSGGVSTVTASFHMTDTLSGVSHVKISNDGVFNTETYQSYTLSTSKELLNPGVQGLKSIYAIFRDFAGNETAVYRDDIMLDYTAPTSINVTLTCPNFVTDGYCDRQSVYVSVTASDNFDGNSLGASWIALANEEGFVVEDFRPMVPTLSWTMSPLDGTKTVNVMLRDAAGNKTSTVSENIVLDTTAPSAVTVTIEGDDATGTSTSLTRTTSVEVDLSATEANPNQMWLSNTNDFSGFTPESFSSPTNNYAWTLDGTDGQKVVFFKVSDLAGNYEVGQGYITLDQSHPIIYAASIDGEDADGISVVSSATSNILNVEQFGGDEIRITGDIVDSFRNTWINAASQVTIELTAGDGDKTVTVEVRDLAGNIPNGTNPVSVDADIRLDATNPTSASFTVDTHSGNCGAGTYNWVKSSAAKLVITANDNRATTGSGIAAYQISEDPTFGDAVWMDWGLATDTVVTPTYLLSDQGEHTIYVRVRDYFDSHITSAGSVCVTLDSQPPDALSVTSSEGSYTGDNSTTVIVSGYDEQLGGYDGLSLLVVAGSDVVVSNGITGVSGGPYDVGEWFLWPVSSTMDVQWLSGEGTKTLTLRASDPAGNKSAPFSMTITRDDTPPGAPDLNFVRSINKGAEVSWDAAVDNYEVDHYRVYYKMNESPTVADTYVSSASITATITELQNRATYFFRVTAIDAAGLESDMSEARSTAVGWTILPITTNESRTIIPQDVVYTDGVIYVLYNEQTYVPETSGSLVLGSLTKLAISRDGGYSWSFHLVRDDIALMEPDGGAINVYGPVPGRGDAKLAVGDEAISVITADSLIVNPAAAYGSLYPVHSGYNTLMLAEFISEDQGLTWRRNPINLYPAGTKEVLGDASIMTSRLGVSKKGSSVVVYFNLDNDVDGDEVVRAIRRDDDVERVWKIIGSLGSDEGTFFSACNANFYDRVAWSGARGTLLPGIEYGRAYSPISPYHAGSDRWLPITGGNNNGDALGFSGTEYSSMTVACSAYKGYEEFYLIGVSVLGSIHLNHKQGLQSFIDGEMVIADFGSGPVTDAESASPAAAYAGGKALYIAYRNQSGNLVVGYSEDATVSNGWYKNIVDNSGDAGFRPVMTGFGTQSPVIVYTDLEGSKLSLARSALIAPQGSVTIQPNQASYSWTSTADMDMFAVSTQNLCVGDKSLSTTLEDAYQLIGSNECVTVAGLDENNQIGDVAETWQLAPFKSVVIENGNNFEDSLSYQTGVAVLGNYVAVLSADKSIVNVFVSDDGASDFPQGSASAVEIYNTGSNVLYRDIAMSTDGSNYYLHVVYNSTGSDQTLKYTRYDLASGSIDSLHDQEDIANPSSSATQIGEVEIKSFGEYLGVIYTDIGDSSVYVLISSNHGDSWQGGEVDSGITMQDLGSGIYRARPSLTFVENNRYFTFNHNGNTVDFHRSTDGFNNAEYDHWACESGYSCGAPGYIVSGKNEHYFIAATADGPYLKLISTGLGQNKIGPESVSTNEEVWSIANIETKEQKILGASMDMVANSDGTWLTYSLCSDTGSSRTWKLKLAYCKENCHSLEGWEKMILVSDSRQGADCDEHWFNGLSIAVDADTNQLFITYAEQVPKLSTQNRILLKSGYVEKKK